VTVEGDGRNTSTVKDLLCETVRQRTGRPALADLRQISCNSRLSDSPESDTDLHMQLLWREKL